MSNQESSALRSLVNIRDLGGLPAGEGRRTRAGVVFRSDAPKAGDRAPEGVAQWPPHTVIDLREPVELGGEDHPLSKVTTVCRLPLLEDVREADVAGEDSGDHELTRLYLGILNGAAKKLVEAFRTVLNSDGPVLVHCAAGKDRTGVVSAMLLSAVGVPEDEIIADYQRTSENMLGVLRRLDVAVDLTPGVDPEAVSGLVATPFQAIRRVLDRFAEFPDGAAGWLRSHGVSEDELRAWRQRFTE